MTLKKRSVYRQGFEVVIFTLIISFIGYFVEPKDPLLIDYTFSFLILWLAIVTLFYGLTMGLVMWGTFSIFALFTYADDPRFTFFLLENLFFVFLYGLFFSNLHSRINKLTIRSKYLQLRLKELTNAFFTLKISHDKLESTYISQPASIRFVISDLLESSEHNSPESSATNTLKILEKFFMVKSAMIWRVKNGSLHSYLSSNGDIDKNVNVNDKLIQESLQFRKAMYLKDLEDKEQTNYIYAVPFLDKRDDVVEILIIKNIPFLFYHEDILLKINVVFTYIWTEYKKRASLDKVRQNDKEKVELVNNHERQDIVDFKLEVVRLNNILKDFDVDSRVYAVSTHNPYLHEAISDYFYQNELLQILDQYVSIECKGRYLHLVLFPFVSKSGIFKPSKDFDNALEEIENQIKMESIDEGLRHKLGSQNYEKMITKHISVSHFNQMLKEYSCVE